MKGSYIIILVFIYLLFENLRMDLVGNKYDID